MAEHKEERIILRVTRETKKKIAEAAKKAHCSESTLLREFIRASLTISDCYVIQTKKLFNDD
jgi:uncharacterized protein (DUF1778 family)